MTIFSNFEKEHGDFLSKSQPKGGLRNRPATVIPMILLVALSPSESRFLEQVRQIAGVAQNLQLIELWETVSRIGIWRKALGLALIGLATPRLLLAFLSEDYARALRASVSRVLPKRLFGHKPSKLARIIFQFWEFPIAPLVRERRFLDHFTRVLDAQKPRVVIFAEETTFNLTPLMIMLAAERGVQTVVLPYSNGVSAEYRTAVSRYRRRKRFEQVVSSRLFPEYSLNHSDKGLLSLPLHCVFLASHLKVPPARLWGAHLDLAGTYLYPDEEDYNNALSLTSDRRKVHLIEPPQATQVLRNRPGVENTQRDFVNCKNLNILILVPPNQFPLRCHFKNYKSLLSSYFASIADATSAKTVCLVSIHPREVIGFDLAVLSPLRNLEIVDTATQGLEIADLVVSYGSALNSVVEYLGIPLVSYNIYGLENLDPVSRKITTVVANRNDFSFHVRDQISRIEKGLGKDTYVRRPTVGDALNQS